LRARVAELEVMLKVQAATAKEPDPNILGRLKTLEADVERAERERRAVEKVAEERRVLAEQNAEKNKILEKRIAELLSERAAAEANAPDIDSLEDKLKERGQAVAALERDLRESLRVGKELVEELEALRETPPDSPGGAGTPPTNGSNNEEPNTKTSAVSVSEASADPGQAEVMKTQLDTLSVRAARSEADLKAAEWRIAQLEMALASAERGEVDPSTVSVELEQALLAAHQELAALRKTQGPEGDHVMASVATQAVLMHQLATQLHRVTP